MVHSPNLLITHNVAQPHIRKMSGMTVKGTNRPQPVSPTQQELGSLILLSPLHDQI